MSEVTVLNVERYHAKHPETFQILTRSQREAVRTGDIVKLIITDVKGSGERMWVEVIECVEGKAYVGTLTNLPLWLPLNAGQVVRFGPEHVLDIWPNEPL